MAFSRSTALTLGIFCLSCGAFVAPSLADELDSLPPPKSDGPSWGVYEEINTDVRNQEELDSWVRDHQVFAGSLIFKVRDSLYLVAVKAVGNGRPSTFVQIHHMIDNRLITTATVYGGPGTVTVKRHKNWIRLYLPAEAHGTRYLGEIDVVAMMNQ